MKITEKIINLETNQEDLIEREATPDEIAQMEADQAAADAAAADAATKEAARAALFDRLGITADEAKLLLG